MRGTEATLVKLWSRDVLMSSWCPDVININSTIKARWCCELLSLSDMDNSAVELFNDEETGVKYRLRQFGKFRCLLVLTVVLFIVCVVLATLFTIENLKTAPESPEAKNQASQANLCDTEDCVFQAAKVLNRLNRSADPCEDFYEYACGGWIDQHPLKNDEDFSRIIGYLTTSNKMTLKSALESDPGYYSKSAAVMKTIRFYNTCIDTASVEKRGSAPLQKLIEEFGGWTVNNGSLQNWAVAKRVGAVTRELGVATLIGVTVTVDWINSSNHIVQLGSPSIGMKRDSYVLNSTKELKVREAYQKYMKTVGRLLGGGNASDSKMMDIYNFEKKLAMLASGYKLGLTVLETLEYLRDAGMSAKDFNTTIEEFCKKTNFRVDFIISLLNETFRGHKVFAKDGKVFVPQFSYFGKLAEFISKEIPKNPDVFADYVMWRLIDTYIIAMPSAFVAAKLEFDGMASAPRQFQCITEMINLFPMQMGLLFVNKKFDEGSRQVVKDMTTRIRKAFIDNLEKAKWMDPFTKKGAREKAEAMKEAVGYPSWIKNTTVFDAKVSKLNITEKLFENLRATMNFIIQENLGKVSQPVDRTEWDRSPVTVNAYSNSLKNKIVILAGILQPPFYNAKRPRYLNYGAIGMVVGHELSHGFDSQGKEFDKYGNYRNWWSKTASQNFEERSQCLVEQYSNYTVYGKHINGEQTLNENIADNGGIKLAYSAYQSWVKNNQPEGRLPGVGLTVDQLFFVGFAQSWCSIFGKTAAYRQMETDEHTIDKYRVIGTLSNFAAFSSAYNCSTGRGMNPTKKCAVW